MKLRRILSLAGGLAMALGVTTAAEAAETRSGGANLREGPGMLYEVVRYVPGGEYVRVYGCQDDGNWCEVKAEGRRGWMHRSRIWFAGSDPGSDNPPGFGQVPGYDGGGSALIILGPVTDRPGYCYATTIWRKTVIVRCHR